MVKPCVIWLSFLWQDAELVAVVEIQPTQAADFLSVFERATDTVDLDGLCRLGKVGELHRIGIFPYAFCNPLVGVIVTELVEPLRSLPSFPDNRPVFSVRVEINSVSHF